MKILEIPVKSINIEENIRQKSEDKENLNLMQSIKDNGLLQPIGVKDLGGDCYTLIWGYRRILSFRKLGYKTIPAVIFVEKDEVMTEQEFFIINSIENLQHKQNTLLELGRVCKILRKTMSVSEIAVRLAIPTGRVQNALSEIQRIPLKWQKRIKLMDAGHKEKQGDIPLTTASRIASLRGLNSKQKDSLYEYASKNDVNMKTMEKIGILMKEGLGLDEAKKVVQNFRSTTLSLFVNVNIERQLGIERKSKSSSELIDFVINEINKKYPRFLVKNITSKH
jgi:ParB/RepB/Spo0J family partition protein